MSRQEVRRVDRCAIETIGVPGVVLMENAGRNATDAVERMLGEAPGKTVAVVAGAGNNGGDGYVIARHLAMRGAKPSVFLISPREKISGDALVNLRIIERLGLHVVALDTAGMAGLAGLSETLRPFDLVVDAIGGTGIRGELRGDLAIAVQQINAAARPVVAVDIPTGLDCDTGQATGPVIRADLTVTFVARKKGFDAPASAQFTGEVQVVDIGVPSILGTDTTTFRINDRR